MDTDTKTSASGTENAAADANANADVNTKASEPSLAKTPSPAVSPPPAKRGRAGLLALWVAVLVLAAALGWVWQDNKKRDLDWQTHTAQQLGALESATEKLQSEQATNGRQVESRLQLMQEKVSALETRVNELQTSRLALEKLYRQLLPLRDDLAMREVESRVRFAMQQLSVGGNVPTALAALQDADAELTALNRPDLASVKTVLAQTVEALQRVPTFDLRGFLTRFDQALGTVDQLKPREIPVAMPEAPSTADEAAPWWRRLWKGTKDALFSMVRLRVHGKVVVGKAGDENAGDGDASTAYLSDTTLDRRELRLRLLALRWMVLARQPMVGSEATATRDWLTQHFSVNDPAVQTLQALLDELAQSPVTTPLPELSPVLQALRRWHAEQAMTRPGDADGQ
ncbi:MAG: uroporphyrinogen-III C-methyltransferase [Betaproteobacteria bacterium]|nr:uroporphyrinogen-III C-methyltransferase [Betaproteobacteria bacterium]